MAEAKTRRRAALTAKKVQVGKPFKSGAEWNGNAAGRPKGSRNKLGEAFIADLYENWKEHGAETIDVVRAEKPDVYVKVVASLMPQHHVVETPEKDLSDEQLEAALGALARVRVILDGGNDAGDDSGSGKAPARGKRQAKAAQ